jgi:hypothetical protein
VGIPDKEFIDPSLEALAAVARDRVTIGVDDSAGVRIAFASASREVLSEA